MAARFPYLPATAAAGESFLMPLLPVRLRFGKGEFVQVQGLVDSGATVNVLPYRLGIQLGAIWESQKTSVTLTGNLATQEARAVLLEAEVGEFPAVRLAFAWTRLETVPLLLGQVNFFQEFDVCFHRRRLQIELAPAGK